MNMVFFEILDQRMGSFPDYNSANIRMIALEKQAFILNKRHQTNLFNYGNVDIQSADFENITNQIMIENFVRKL